MSSLPPSPSPSSRSHSSAEVEEQLLFPQAPHDSSDTEERDESTSPGNPPQPSAALPATNSNSDTTAQDLIEEAEVEAQLLIKDLDVTEDEFIKLEKRLIGHNPDASTDIANIKAMIKTLRDAIMTKSQFLREKKKNGFPTYTVKTISLSRIKETHIEFMGLPTSKRERVSEKIFKERVLDELLKTKVEMNLTLIRQWQGIKQFSETLGLIKKHLGGQTEARSRFAVDQFVLEVIRLFRTPIGLRDVMVFTELVLATQKLPTIFDSPAEKRALIVTGKGDYLISSYHPDRYHPFPFQAFKVVVSYTDIKAMSEHRLEVAMLMIETKNLALEDLTPYLDQAIGEAMVIMAQSRNGSDSVGSGLGGELTPEPVSFCLTNSEIWIFGVVVGSKDGSYSCRYTDPIKEGSTHSITDLFHAFAIWATVSGSTLNGALGEAIHPQQKSGR